MPTYMIRLTPETEIKARATIAQVINQAQNGVTIFDTKGVLAAILFDLEYIYYDKQEY